MRYESLETTDLGIGEKHSGKVRDSYFIDDRIIMIATDRVSVFDQVVGTIPFKGQILNQLSSFWFNQTEHIVQNHLIDVPDPNTSIVRKYSPIPLEVIVRGHIRENGFWKRLNYPIVTPTTKAEKGYHDEPITREEIIRKGILTGLQFREIEDLVLKLFIFGRDLTYEAGEGFELLDTKYEFAFDKEGRPVLIDEVHTPDSSRTKRQFDKEFLRQWFMAKGYSGEGEIPEIPDEVKKELFNRYVAFYENITGSPFVPEKNNNESRIKFNLRKEGYL